MSETMNWKEVFMAYFNILPYGLPGGTKGNLSQDSWSPGSNLDQVLSSMKRCSLATLGIRKLLMHFVFMKKMGYLLRQ
jgi:hypothetical protein